MGTRKRKAQAPRLRVSSNADALLRSLMAANDPASLRRLAMNPEGRAELQRMQRVATARVEEFHGCLELARSVEASISDALRSPQEASR